LDRFKRKSRSTLVITGGALEAKKQPTRLSLN
jgi:hypothetical protein